MRIFLTGATGYVGAAVLESLVRGGHEVTALVRHKEKAKRVARRGAHAVVGDLTQPESFAAELDAQDGYVHAAYDSRSGPAVERSALEIILKAAARPRTGSSASAKRFVIYTSGIWILGRTPEPATEDAPINPIEHAAWRPGHEQLVLSAASDTLRTVVVRPGLLYGGGTGIVGDLFAAAT